MLLYIPNPLEQLEKFNLLSDYKVKKRELLPIGKWLQSHLIAVLQYLNI